MAFPGRRTARTAPTPAYSRKRTDQRTDQRTLPAANQLNPRPATTRAPTSPRPIGPIGRRSASQSEVGRALSTFVTGPSSYRSSDALSGRPVRKTLRAARLPNATSRRAARAPVILRPLLEADAAAQAAAAALETGRPGRGGAARNHPDLQDRRRPCDLLAY